MAFTLTAEGTSWQFVEATFSLPSAPALQLQTITKIEGGSSVDTEAVYGAGAKIIDRTQGIIKTDNVKISIGPSDWAALYNSLLAAAIPQSSLYNVTYTGNNPMDLLLSKAGQFTLTVSFQLVNSFTIVFVQFNSVRLAKVPFSANQGAAPVKMEIEFTCDDVQWFTMGS